MKPKLEILDSGITTLRVCVEKTMTDAEIIEVCNTIRPEIKWEAVWRMGEPCTWQPDHIHATVTTKFWIKCKITINKGAI